MVPCDTVQGGNPVNIVATTPQQQTAQRRTVSALCRSALAFDSTSTPTSKADKMKYFEVRRRRVGKSKTPSTLGSIDKKMGVGADLMPKEGSSMDFQADNSEQIQQIIQEPYTIKERDRSKDRLSFARRRKDIRLTRKEVSCLQVLVQTVLNEHLVLSRELQAANERMGLPLEPAEMRSPLARNVERLQSALERDATRLKAALRDREERLERTAEDAASLRQELEKWRLDSAQEATLQRERLEKALAERDSASAASAEKDEVISDLRTKIANLELKKSNEALTLSRHLTEKEITIKKLESLARDTAAELAMLQAQHAEIVALLDMERTALHSTKNDVGALRSDLKIAREDYEATVIMMSKVLSDKDVELEDIKMQIEDAKREFEEDVGEVKRSAIAEVAQVKHSLEQIVAQKMVELQELQSNFNKSQMEVKQLSSELKRERDKAVVVHGELAAARNELANTKERESASSKQVLKLEAQLAEERVRHNAEMQKRNDSFEDRLKKTRADADLERTNLENRLLKRQKEVEQQLAAKDKELRKVENRASRIPTLESNLNEANNEIQFLKEKATERNAELGTKKKEASHYLEEVERLKKEMESASLKQEELAKKLREELESMKAKREEDGSHFRKAIHEKDLEIRERQDRLEEVEREQEAIQKSLSNVQKALDDTTHKHKNAMTNAKTNYRETLSNLKKDIAKKSDEIKSLQETVNTLHTKMTEQQRQHAQEVERLKSLWEKTRNSLEKKIREKEVSLKEISADLSKAVESKEIVLRELEKVREELKRTVNVLVEAKAETRLALDTMVETERAMTIIYADSVQRKLALTETQRKIEDIEKKWLEASKEAEERERIYNKLKARFFSFVKFQENERKAAGDSAEQNKAEAQRYFNELNNSKTELAKTRERCQTLKTDLEWALGKVECLSENETALLAQSDQNTQRLVVAEAEVEELKNALRIQSSELFSLKTELAEKESQLEMISADLSREQSLSAKHSAECENVLGVIESISRERGFLLDPEMNLHDGVDLVFENIRLLETQLAGTSQQLATIKQEHKSLKEELSTKTSLLKEKDNLLVQKNEYIEKLQSDLTECLRQMSDQQSKITALEKYIEDIVSQAKAVFNSQEDLRRELEEGKNLLHDADSRIEQLTNQLEHERSRVAELQTDLTDALAMKNSFERELDVQSLSIQESLSRLEVELQSNEVLSKTLEERTDEAANLRERVNEQDREVNRLLGLLEHAHQDCQGHHESADGDGKKEPHSEGLKELKNALAERDADVAKLRSVIVELQSELSANKSTSDEEIASYRFYVEELSNEIAELKKMLFEQSELRVPFEQTKFDLHWTAEQTRLGERLDGPRVLPRRRPGAPGGAPPKRTILEGNAELETDASELAPAVQIPIPSCTDAQ